jgi:hypothetical protein
MRSQNDRSMLLTARRRECPPRARSQARPIGTEPGRSRVIRREPTLGVSSTLWSIGRRLRPAPEITPRDTSTTTPRLATGRSWRAPALRVGPTMETIAIHMQMVLQPGLRRNPATAASLQGGRANGLRLLRDPPAFVPHEDRPGYLRLGLRQESLPSAHPLPSPSR